MTDTVFTVTENCSMGGDIYCLTLLPDVYQQPHAGCFINISVPGRTDLILRRPFAICGWDDSAKTVKLCFKVVGKGTNSLKELKPGDKLTGIYPLGNGFNLGKSKKIALIGGGIGVFPLLSVLRQYGDDAERTFYSFIGYRDAASAVFYNEFNELSSRAFVCTDDCSLGEEGLVTELFDRHCALIKPDLVLACGPTGMLRALQTLMRESYPDILAYVSLEERMCCGFGACMVCTCAVKENGNVKNKRVCSDGPVFRLDEVVF